MGDISLGQLVYTAVKPIFKIYMIIGVGFYLSRKNILTVETSKNISAIAIKVLIPCLSFQKIVTNINNTMIHEISTIVIIAYFIMFAQGLVVFSVGILVGCPRNWRGGLFCCGLLPNISDLSIAYLQSLETSNVFENIDLGVSFVIIYMGLQLFLQFTLGSYKFIEYDFEIDRKVEAQKELERSSLSTKACSVSDSTKSVLSATTEINTNPVQRVPIVNVDQSQNNNCLESIQTNRSIDSYESISLHHSNIPRFEPPSDMVEKVSHTSRNNLMTHTSPRGTLPLSILENPMLGAEHETVEDIVRVYSKYDDIVQKKDFKLLAKGKQFSIIQYIKEIDWKSKFWMMMEIWKDSFRQPASVVVVISFIICMVPWLQALFVESSQVTLPSAPDKQPPLSFIMDFAGYIGAAQVPFGLLLLGGTIGRLDLDSLPKNLWRLPIAITFVKLFIFPIIGCAFDSKIYRNGMFYGQDILYFVSNISFCLPPATSLLYITAFYTPNDGKTHIQMNILALVYIFHYICLVVCLPFTATYTMKVSLNF